jgi:hypothetical protein
LQSLPVPVGMFFPSGHWIGFYRKKFGPENKVYAV